MILSDQHRFGFVHIPKSAGTTVRFALMEHDDRKARYFDKARIEHPLYGMLDYAHLPLALINEFYPEDYTLLERYRTFALIRDPLSRFASSLNEYLRWNTGESLANITRQERDRIVRDVISKLASLPDDTPVTDASLIHFSRQSDYVEYRGERIAKELYRAEDVDAMLNKIAAMIGAQIDPTPRNQRKSYRWEALRIISEAVQRPIQRVLPQSIWQPAFRKARSVLVAVGLFRFDKDRDFSDLFDADVKAFVHKFYQRDFALRRELSPPSALQSGTRAGVQRSDDATKSVCA